MRLFFLWMITLSFGFVMAEPSSAQTYPTAEEILKAWLLSPHANSKSESFRHWDTESRFLETAQFAIRRRVLPNICQHRGPHLALSITPFQLGRPLSAPLATVMERRI